MVARLREFHANGTEAFILSGWPLVSQAQGVARTVLPLLDLEHGFVLTPFDEGDAEYERLRATVPTHDWPAAR